MKFKKNNKNISFPNKPLFEQLKRCKFQIIKPKKGKGSYNRKNRKVFRNLSI